MITPESVAGKSFRRTLFGYDMEQVDRYLDEIIVLLQQYQQERAEMQAMIDRLAAKNTNSSGTSEPDPALLPSDEL